MSCIYQPVADPGPLMLGVLDRWTPTVNILQTQIAHISFHIELCPIEARYSISLNVRQNIPGQKIPCHVLPPRTKHPASICHPGQNIPHQFATPDKTSHAVFVTPDKTSHAIFAAPDKTFQATSATPDRTSHTLFKAYESA